MRRQMVTNQPDRPYEPPPPPDVGQGAEIRPPLWSGGEATHATKTQDVHGTGSDVHVLGTKIGSGVRVEYGRHNHTHSGGSTQSTTVTFANAFTATPFVVASLETGSGTGELHDVYDITTTNFVARHVNSAGETDYINYIAVGT